VLEAARCPSVIALADGVSSAVVRESSTESLRGAGSAASSRSAPPCSRGRESPLPTRRPLGSTPTVRGLGTSASECSVAFVPLGTNGSGGSYNLYVQPGWTLPQHYGGSGCTPPVCLDTAVNGMTHAVCIVRGMHPLATLSVRAYTGLEVVPCWDSPSLPFTRSPAPYDNRILDVYYAVSNRMGTAFPASYNLFGGLLTTILSVVTRALPYIGRGLLYAGGLAARDYVQRPQVAAAPRPARHTVRAPTPARRQVRPRQVRAILAPPPRLMIGAPPAYGRDPSVSMARSERCYVPRPISGPRQRARRGGR
jgi:hypothetical protein